MASSKKSVIIPITEEDLIEAGMRPKKQTPKVVKGPSTKEKHCKFIPIDEELLAELRREVAPPDYSNFKFTSGPPRSNSVIDRRQSGNNIHAMKRTSNLIRKSTNIEKKIVKKAVSNINKVLNNSGQNSMEYKYLTKKVLDNRQLNVRKKLFNGDPNDNKMRDDQSEIAGKFFKPPRITINNYNSPLMDIRNLESKNEKSTAEAKHQYHQLISRLSTVQEEKSLTPSTSGCTPPNISPNRHSSSSNSEFEKMEQLCESGESREVLNKLNKIISDIKIDQEEFEKYKRAHESRFSSIIATLKEIAANIGDQQKDSKQQSISKPKKNKTIPGTSDKMIKAGNLRKSVLKMNIIKNQGNTPIQKKAEKMYNSLRDQYSMLVTPKFNKKGSSESPNISTKLQQQCLMLLDTPQRE